MAYVADFDRDTNVIGKEEIKEKFAKRIISGDWDYAMDHFPGTKLFTGIVTCPYAHAIIKSVDTSEAEKMPGVKAVCTYKEVDAPAMPRPADGETSSEITYQGMMVAAVAATDPWLAHQAAQKIKVEYEQLPFVVDMEKAIAPDAPAWKQGAKSNSTTNVVFERGDVDEAMAKDKTIVQWESGYASFYSHNSPETRSATAQWVGDELWVYQGSQMLSNHQTNIAKAMRIPETNLHFISHGMGGGYGDRKPNGEAAWIAATLAKKTGTPVGCRTSRACMATGAATHQYTQQCTIKLGINDDNIIDAVETYWKGNSGKVHIQMTESRATNWRITEQIISTNIPRTGPFRSVSGMHGCFCTDQAIDQAAYDVGMDPFDFRYKNAVTADIKDAATGRPRGVTAMREVMDVCAKEFGWKQKFHMDHNKRLCDVYPDKYPNDKRKHGVGMCNIVSEKGAGTPGRTVIIRANPDGTFHVNYGIGRASSGTSTAVSVVVAETLGTSFSKVNYTVGEALLAGNGGMQAGSTGTNANCFGAYDAAVAIRDAMFEKAASTLGVGVDELTSKDGKVYVTKDPSKSLTHAQCIGSTPIIRYGDGTRLGEGYFKDADGYKVGQPSTIRTYVCQMVEIAVDEETGEIEILDFVDIPDVGRCLFRDGLMHQIEGAMTMQLGVIKAWEQLFDPATGATVNGSFIDQKNATTMDVPIKVMKPMYYESHNNSSPYGVMGVGEPPIIPYVAFHNALYNACGVRVKETTMSPARVLKALGKI